MEELYPVDEFLRHVTAVHEYLEEEKIRREPVRDEKGNVAFEWTVIRVNEFMRQSNSPEVACQKSMRFCSIMHFISTHFQEFDQSDFAVYGSDRVGGLVGDHLLRATYQLFLPDALAQSPNGPTPAEVMALARKIEDESNSEKA